MSSSSDDNYDEAISSDKEAMEVDSDEQLLDDAEPVEENKPKEVKKHKRSFDPRYAVPTNEEKQMMRDADMEVEVSMIEMEVSGRCLCHCLVHSCCSLIFSFSPHSPLFSLPLSLLSHSPQANQFINTLSQKHTCDAKLTSFLKEMNAFLSSLPEKDVTPPSSTHTLDLLQGHHREEHVPPHSPLNKGGNEAPLLQARRRLPRRQLHPEEPHPPAAHHRHDPPTGRRASALPP
mgnify:CR=1 FL=1